MSTRSRQELYQQLPSPGIRGLCFRPRLFLVICATRLSFDLETADSSVTGFLAVCRVGSTGGTAEAVVRLAVDGRDGTGGAIPTEDGQGRVLGTGFDDAIITFEPSTGIEDNNEVEVTD